MFSKKEQNIEGELGDTLTLNLTPNKRLYYNLLCGATKKIEQCMSEKGPVRKRVLLDTARISHNIDINSV